MQDNVDHFLAKTGRSSQIEISILIFSNVHPVEKIVSICLSQVKSSLVFLYIISEKREYHERLIRTVPSMTAL